MLTRNQREMSNILISLYDTNSKSEKQMNMVRLYYKSANKKRLYDTEYYDDEIILTVCLTNEQLNKIKYKRIIVYKNNDYDDYDTAELLDFNVVNFDLNLKNKINKSKQHIISSIDDNLLDDVTSDMMLEDDEIEMSKILVNLKKTRILKI